VKSKSLIQTYAEKRGNLVRVFAARLRSMAEAEDLIQDLFFKIERLEIQEVGENPSALLFQMANHLMLDRLRSLKRAGARDAVCTVKRQLFDSPLRVIAPHLKASKIRFIQSNQTVRSPGGE